MFTILGLYLLRLLTLNKLAEFHMELETYSIEQLSNVFIKHPIQVEQDLMVFIIKNRKEVIQKYGIHVY